MKKDIRLKGQLRFYMQWPIFMLILLVAMTIWIFFTSSQAGIMMAIIVTVYGIGVGVLYMYSKSLIMADLVQFAAQYGVVQNTLLKELSIPYALLMDDGQIIWMNDSFKVVTGQGDKAEKYINKVIPELNRGVFPKAESEQVQLNVIYKEKEYSVAMHKVSVEGFSETEELLQLPKEKEYFIAIYLKDVTELNKYIRENDAQKMVAGLIYIDNFDEVIESVEEVRQSLLVALIDRKINQYIAKIDGIVKKMEKDKYFIVIKKKYFQQLKEDKFALLEEVKGISIGNEMPATLSIGLGMSTDTYAQSYNYARVAIDLALARGGDQAVVKDANNITYFGGKREQVAKNTRVKARVKAEALREFIAAKDKVIVMGHKIGDVDSFGAAIGIYRAATIMEKKVHIVINDITSSVRPLYERIRDNAAYDEDLFLTSSQVEDVVTEIRWLL